MPFTDLLLSQLTDPFRIGLIMALLYTTLRNRAVTGQIGPLLLGIAFVAIVIPMTIQTDNPDPIMWRFAVGTVANTILLGVVWGLWSIVQRMRA